MGKVGLVEDLSRDGGKTNWSIVGGQVLVAIFVDECYNCFFLHCRCRCQRKPEKEKRTKRFKSPRSSRMQE